MNEGSYKIINNRIGIIDSDGTNFGIVLVFQK